MLAKLMYVEEILKNLKKYLIFSISFLDVSWDDEQ